MTKQTPFGRLAQLGERPLDVRKVTGSSPVSSTKKEDKTENPLKNACIQQRVLCFCLMAQPRRDLWSGARKIESFLRGKIRIMRKLANISVGCMNGFQKNTDIMQ